MNNGASDDIFRDPEYAWLIRTCTNAINLCVTLVHTSICETIAGTRVDNDPGINSLFSKKDILVYR